MIHSAMLTYPAAGIKNKRFLVEVSTDSELFRTEAKKGASPKWNHSQTINSKNGDIVFKLLEKVGMFR